MSKYITLPSTVTSASLGLVKGSTTSKTIVSSPTVYTIPYYKLTSAPHISVLIHTLKKGSATSMLPYLVGHTISFRGSHTSIKIGGATIPTGSIIISTTASGLITYSTYYYTGGYFHYPLKVSVYTSTMKLSTLVKMLKSGSYTMK